MTAEACAMRDGGGSPRFWTARRKRLYAAYAALSALACGYFELDSWSESHLFLVNSSASLPNWAFLIARGAEARPGDYIFFDPPQSGLVRRHFGPQPRIFGKIVYGSAGDHVTRIGRTFFINGKQIAVAKPRSFSGEPLALGPTGTIPPGCHFVGTPHKDGLDSRYAAIGWICRRRILGTGSAIL
jgi:conjugal transfer pilin signal peptidase TrbI